MLVDTMSSDWTNGHSVTQRNLQECAGKGIFVADAMAEDKGSPFHGGKQSRRHRTYGIDDQDFWRWWHRMGKDEAGGGDLASRDVANRFYEEWIAIGRPEAK